MMISHRARRGLRPRTVAAERGSALVIALVFMIVFTLLLTSLLGFAMVNSRTSIQVREQRAQQYAVDGALEGAVSWVANDTRLGTDPNYFSSQPPCVYQQDASTVNPVAPAITVVCSAVPGANSGRQEKPGIVPDAAILTLGRRATEPGSYNDNTDCPAGFERGILVRETKSCTAVFGSTTPAERREWTVVGPVASNSTIELDAGSINARNSDGSPAEVLARSSCSGTTCTVVGETADEPLLEDPGYDHRPLTVDGKTGGTPLTVRTIATSCTGTVTAIEPGIYRSALAINTLFASPSCRDKYIWFKPGVYYFDFRDNGESFTSCGNVLEDDLFEDAVVYEPANNHHLWCVGATNNTNLHVVGGTPFGDWKGLNMPALGTGFPRQINEAAGDPGGDCDPNEPGVQFIFGGDSRLYVADGNFELCAGPDPNSPSDKPQIALYGVPAVPELVATSATSSGGTVTNAGDGRVIGEPGTRVDADLSYRPRCGNPAADPQNVDCGLLDIAPTIKSHTLTLSGFRSSYTLPAGASVKSVTMRASYDTDGIITSPEYRIYGSGWSCSGSNLPTIPPQDGLRQRELDVTDCFDNDFGRLWSDFSVDWTAKGRVLGCSNITNSCAGGPYNEKLDGIQFQITLTSDPSSRTPIAQSGCIVDHPNYQDGIGEGDCPVFKVDQSAVKDTILSIPVAGSNGWVGRASFKGTVYVPSAAIDFADEDVQYPLFSRGLIARHLRLKAYYSQAGIPMSEVEIDPRVYPRRVAFTACTQGPGANKDNCSTADGDVILGEAEVSYRVDSAVPTTSACYQPDESVQAARCPEIQNWYVRR